MALPDNAEQPLWQITARQGNRRGASWPLRSTPLILGRSRKCDIVIQDPAVSREHCSLRQEAGEIIVEDLGSSNAPLVNGRPTTRCILAQGDVLSIGSATFVVTRAADPKEEELKGITHQSTVFPRPLQFDRESVQPQLDAAPRSIWDLYALHCLVTQLAHSASDAEVAEAIIATVSENTPFDRCRVLRCREDDQPLLLYPDGESLNLRLLASARQCLETQQMVLHTQGARNCLLVPMAAAGKAVGVIVTEGEAQLRETERPDSFVFAVGKTAAPYFLLAAQPSASRTHNAAPSPVCAEIVGVSPAAEQIRRLAQFAAEVDLPLLLHGETGTGKELVARLVHRLSLRSRCPFIAVNCAAVPDTLFESEFFGHVKGAFTGANEKRSGLIAEAEGGVLFLDEISELSLSNQARFLRAIETGKYRAVGSSHEVDSNFRVISASNQDLLGLVQQGKFRADLYFRLCGFEISLPPLRNRAEDIPALVGRFATEYAAERAIQPPVLPLEALAYLSALSWRGNIRELRNVARRIVAFPAGAITLEQVKALAPLQIASAQSQAVALDSVEQEHIARVLQQYRGQIARAAEALGMHRNTLRRKIKHYKL